MVVYYVGPNLLLTIQMEFDFPLLLRHLHLLNVLLLLLQSRLLKLQVKLVQVCQIWVYSVYQGTYQFTNLDQGTTYNTGEYTMFIDAHDGDGEQNFSNAAASFTITSIWPNGPQGPQAQAASPSIPPPTTLTFKATVTATSAVHTLEYIPFQVGGYVQETSAGTGLSWKVVYRFDDATVSAGGYVTTLDCK